MLPPGGHAFPVPAVRLLGAPELRRLRCPLVPASDRCVLGGRKKPEVGPLLGFQWMRCLPLEALFNHGLSSLCPQPLQITRALFSPKSVKAACVDTASPSPAPSEHGAGRMAQQPACRAPAGGVGLPLAKAPLCWHALWSTGSRPVSVSPPRPRRPPFGRLRWLPPAQALPLPMSEVFRFPFSALPHPGCLKAARLSFDRTGPALFRTLGPRRK